MKNLENCYKKTIFNQLFENKVKRYHQPREGKYCDAEIICTNNSLNSYFHQLYSKYNTGSYSNFFNECVLIAYEAIQKFEPLEDMSSYEGIIDGSDELNRNRILSYIKISVKYNIIKEVNPELKYTTTIDDQGNKRHTAYKLSPESIEGVIYSEDGGDINIGDTLTDDSSLFSLKSGTYESNHYIQWFNENKEDILVPSQLDFLDDLENHNSAGGITQQELINKHGGEVGEFNRKLKRLGNRVERFYKREFPYGGKSLLEMEREAEIALWEEALAIIQTDDVDRLLNLTEWLKHNQTVESVMELLVKEVEGDNSKELNRHLQGKEDGVIHSRILYPLINSIIKRVKYLKIPKLTTQHQAAYNRLDESNTTGFKSSPITIYNLEGELIGSREPQECTGDSSTLILNIDTYGEAHKEVGY